MDLMSLRSAARELGVAERTLRRDVEAGELPAYRVGRRTIRIERSALVAWLDRKRV